MSTRKTDWALIDKCLASEAISTIYFHGPPGIGKTYCAYHHGAERLARGLFAITMTEDTPVAELRGHYVPNGGEMVWRDGPFTLAMKQGARLVINEVTHGSPEALSFLYPVLEDASTARLTLPTNETVVPADGFHIVCTDNAPPEALPPALQDRFQVTFQVTEPHPEAIAKLSAPLGKAAKRAMQLEETGRRISLRSWFALQSLIPELGEHNAFRAVFGAKGNGLRDAIKLAAGTSSLV